MLTELPFSVPERRVGWSARRPLLVASSGGHLVELVEIASRLPTLADAVWLTPTTPQSRELLRGAQHLDVPNVKPRDLRGMRRTALVARQVLRTAQIDLVVSTGAGIALAVLPQAVLRGIETHYVESAARVNQPSLTGRLLVAVPGVKMWTQYPENTTKRRSYLGSLFEHFEVVARDVDPSRPLRIVVTLGTMHRFSFHRLVTRLLNVLPEGSEVLWQYGSADARDLGIADPHAWVSPVDLTAAMESADVVVAHAGVGSALAAMRAGAFPILVPRRVEFGEHIDDHQVQIGTHFAARGLAFSVAVSDVTPELVHAARHLALRRARTELGALSLAEVGP
ncbi:glycosyltransferase [Kineococcus sp. GCM10028916]|uniref:glycosyltransferase n=1 Tax=Kineococcus sp. GCM10028916 TaxID=3273394 RepID=UPI003625B896